MVPCWQVLTGGHAARDYQDERFSYVILAKGPRPAPGASSAAATPIARRLVTDPLYSSASPSVSATQLQAPGVLSTAQRQLASRRSAARQPAKLHAAVEQLMLESLALGEDSEDETAEDVRAWLAATPLRSAAETSPSDEVAPAAHASNISAESDACGAAPLGDESDAEMHPTMTAIEDNPTSAASSGMHARPELTLSPAEARGYEAPNGSQVSNSLEEQAEDADSQEQGDEALGLDEHWRLHHPQHLSRAAAASAAWSRIIRRPRKRRRHVLVDICTASGSVKSNEPGELCYGCLVMAQGTLWDAWSAYRSQGAHH